MSVAAEKGVEGGTASPLISLSLGEEVKEEGLDLMKRYPCRQSKDFNNEQRKTKTINYQSSWKGTPLAEAPYLPDIFLPS